MLTAPWRSPLARALHINRSLVSARYFQLATIDNYGYPANRTVVFRGFLEETNQIKIITDLRSQKASQIRDHPQGEICWYFPKSREQFRFRGYLTLVTADYISDQAINSGEKLALQTARQQLWQNISEAARNQFLWDSPGELVRMDSPDLATPVETPDPINPVENFCLLLLDPFQVDHLELRTNPQCRHIYIQDQIFNKTLNQVSNKIPEEIPEEILDELTNKSQNKSQKIDRIKNEDNWHTKSVNP